MKLEINTAFPHFDEEVCFASASSPSRTSIPPLHLLQIGFIMGLVFEFHAFV
jgi:hypothetical protein